MPTAESQIPSPPPPPPPPPALIAAMALPKRSLPVLGRQDGQTSGLTSRKPSGRFYPLLSSSSNESVGEVKSFSEEIAAAYKRIVGQWEKRHGTGKSSRDGLKIWRREARLPSAEDDNAQYMSLKLNIARRTAGLSLRQRPGSVPVSGDGWSQSVDDRLLLLSPTAPRLQRAQTVGYTIFAPGSVEDASIYFDKDDPFGLCEYPPLLKDTLDGLLERYRLKKVQAQLCSDHNKSNRVLAALDRQCQQEIQALVESHPDNHARGKVLLVLRGNCHDCEKVQHAQSRGCLGLIIIR